MEDAPDDDLHFWGDNEYNALFQQCVNGAEPSEEILQFFYVEPNASKK